MAAIGDRFRQDLQARPPRRHPGRRIPRPRRRRADRDAVRRRSGDGAEKGPRAVPADPGAQRKSVKAAVELAPAAATDAAPERELRKPSYWPFVVPALVVVLAIIIFPWLFTI